MPEFDDHELVTFLSDKGSGLKSFVVIHNTNLGPSVGGTRYWNYGSEEEALRDGLRLSRAMTYKCALAGVPFGGGKAVIIASNHNPKKKEILGAYAKRVNIFKGNFSTGEDVGIDQNDVDFMYRYSRFIIGRTAGDLGIWTAWGLYYAVLPALEAVYGNGDARGRTFAVKGIGKVGGSFVEIIRKKGARVIVADIDKEKIRKLRKKYPDIETVSPKEIHKQRVDVYAPCALGGEFSKKTIPQLRCAIICGGANNQLALKEDGGRLHSWGVLYVPDYLANAGGLINVVAELDKSGYSRRRVIRKIKGVRSTARKIIRLSLEKNKATSEVADRLAESIFKSKNTVKYH